MNEVDMNTVLVLTTHYLNVISPTVKRDGPNHPAGTPRGPVGVQARGPPPPERCYGFLHSNIWDILRHGYAPKKERDDAIAGTTRSTAPG